VTIDSSTNRVLHTSDEGKFAGTIAASRGKKEEKSFRVFRATDENRAGRWKRRAKWHAINVMRLVRRDRIPLYARGIRRMRTTIAARNNGEFNYADCTCGESTRGSPSSCASARESDRPAQRAPRQLDAAFAWGQEGGGEALINSSLHYPRRGDHRLADQSSLYQPD